MPFNLGLGEVLVVLVIALIVFGGRLPQVGRSLGQGLREFKKGIQGASSRVEEDEPETGTPPEQARDRDPRDPEGPEDGTEGDSEEEGGEDENEEDPSKPTPGDRSP